MKTADRKREFIRLRAEGKSYRAIEAETGISRTTCCEWEKELRSEIDKLRQDNLEELYTAYGMAREARIRRIGDTLRRIDDALEAVDLTKLSPDKLLDYKLKYQAALRNEYSASAGIDATGTATTTLDAMQDLYRRTASGEASAAQAKAELNVLDHMTGDYERANPFDVLCL